MTSPSLTLFLPGLFESASRIGMLAENERPSLKYLQRFIARSRKNAAAPSDLAALFNLSDLSAAALSRCVDANEADAQNWYMRADPVYIVPDRDSAVLHAHEALQLSLDEARELAEAITAHFTEEGWTLEVLASHRWYLKADKPQDLKTYPLAVVMGQHIRDYLPTGGDSAYWQRLMNEVQMLLYTHPVNQQREASGQLPINSLWLWGGGRLPERKPLSWQTVFGESVLVQALTQWGGCAYENVPEDPQVLLSRAEGQTLVVFERLAAAVRNEEYFVALAALQELNERWLPTLFNALKSGQLTSLTLLPGDGSRYVLTSGRLRQWWRQGRPLWQCAKAGA